MRAKKKGRFEPTDTGNAEWFASLYKDRLRYDHRAKRWVVWLKHWWEEDTAGDVMGKAKRAARLLLLVASKLPDKEGDAAVHWALDSRMRHRLEAAITLAKSERPLSDPGTNWDGDPWLLGVSNGVVDLRPGKRRKGFPSDQITMHTKIPFNSSAKCPRWKRFLSEVFTDQELIDFVQRALGYSITGQTKEQCVFLCYGEGANGKSTFLEVLRYVLGDYAHNTPFSTLELKGRTSIPNDVAALLGRRFVTAIETNDSVRLNEARLKGLTGSDAISARYLHKEFFTFNPVAKLWLAFNHKPLVADDSYGFWRRIRLIPFLQTFKDRFDDKNLIATLKPEAPGILAWIVQGCLRWQAEGLEPPAIVRATTEQYRKESDPLGEFIDQCCVVQEGKRVAAGTLWVSYRSWVTENGEPLPLDRAAFARRLGSRGLHKVRDGHARTRTWVGICLRPAQKIPELIQVRP